MTESWVSTRARPRAHTVLASALYRLYLAVLTKLRVGRRATEERRWTQRASEGTTVGLEGRLGERLGSEHHCFAGLNSEDMGTQVGLVRVEGKVTA